VFVDLEFSGVKSLSYFIKKKKKKKSGPLKREGIQKTEKGGEGKKF